MTSVLALNMTVQLELTPSALAVSRHGVTLAVEPAGWLVKLRRTVRCGAVLVPESVSATLTVQVAGLLAGVESGQSSVVEVERAVTMIVSLPLLAAWMSVALTAELQLSPQLPCLLALDMTMQLEVTPSALAVFFFLMIRPPPRSTLLPYTTLFRSCGAVLVPESVSATLTVQVAGLLAGVESGQSSVVEVERAVTMIVSLPLLAAWMEVGSGERRVGKEWRSGGSRVN